MRRFLVLLALLAMVLSVGGDALAQMTVPNQGTYFPQPGNRKIEGNLWITDGLYIGGTRTDNVTFLPATQYCMGSDGTNVMIPTRVSAFDWALQRTATGYESFFVSCNIPIPTKSTSGAGIKITGYSLVAQNVTVLVGATFNGAHIIRYASGVSNLIQSASDVKSSLGSYATPNLVSATQTVPNFAYASLTASPTWFTTLEDHSSLKASASLMALEWAPRLAPEHIYRVYGIIVFWQENW